MPGNNLEQIPRPDGTIPQYGDDDWVAPPGGERPFDDTVPPLDGVDGMCPCPEMDCYAACQAADKEKQKQCTELNKAHSERMKTLGCPGTKCSTKPIGKACRKKTAKCAPRKKKCAPKRCVSKIKKRCLPPGGLCGPRMTPAEVATIKWIIGGRRGPCP